MKRDQPGKKLGRAPGRGQSGLSQVGHGLPRSERNEVARWREQEGTPGRGEKRREKQRYCRSWQDYSKNSSRR